MEILPLKTTSVKKVYETMHRVLSNGGLVIAPSDSVYGALVDATNYEAVTTLIQFKKRPQGKPISVFVSDMEMLQDHGHISEDTQHILDRILPGPFTVVVPSKHKLISLLESEDATLGLRIPDYPFITSFIKKYGSPVTATSANMAGRSPHYSKDSLIKALPQYKQQMIDLIIDAGTLPSNKPSTVIDLSGDSIKTLRAGDIELQAVDSFVSRSAEQTFRIGRYIADYVLKSGTGKSVLLLLHGELGAGKTQFVKGVASRFGIDSVISPTYVISYEYEIYDEDGFDRFNHIDLYNIQQEDEIDNIGLYEGLKNAITCVEWAEKGGSRIEGISAQTDTYHVHLAYTAESTRSIVITKSPSSS